VLISCNEKMSALTKQSAYSLLAISRVYWTNSCCFSISVFWKLSFPPTKRDLFYSVYLPNYFHLCLLPNQGFW